MRISLIGTVLFFSCAILAAQEPNEQASRITMMRAKYQTPPYDSLLQCEFHRYGLTDDKLDKLKQIGLDVKECIIREETDDPGFAAALCDLVVIGKVLQVTAMPGVKSKLFHSTVRIEIIEVLKGPRSEGKTLEIVSENGPITDDRDSILANVDVTSEAEFHIGETSILFLKNIFTDPSFASRRQALFTNHSADFFNPTYHVHAQSKYRILDSTVIYHRLHLPLESFVSRVKKVSHIVDTASSY